MARHADATVGNVHIIYNWTYADTAAREAATGMVTGDVGKFCRQLDDNTIWMLTDDDPVTWVCMQGFVNPMTTEGDIIYGGTDGAATRLGIGSPGQLLAVDDDGIPVWQSGGAGGNNIYTAAYASRPASDVEGDLFFPSDGFSVQRDTGAAWVPWGPLFPLTEPPAVEDFTWGNQGTATATKTKGGIYITDTTNSNVNRILYKAAPATPFTLTIGFMRNSLGVNNEAAGMLLRQSADGKQVTFASLFSGGEKIEITKWSAHTTWVGAYKSSGAGLSACYGSPVFFRYYDDGSTNREFSISRDGQNFLTFLSQSRTDYLTIDQIGFYIGMNGSGSSVGMTLMHWSVG